ncbi:beta strand repeat-containing protein [Stappia sp.]|uniref:beta strand repeat-containing protein n=1 Tax=Stappia sp. TaxID=1870903 RepID=UPI003C7C70F1
MLSSSCAAALLAGTGGQAAAQDAPRLWGAWGELGAQAGAETNAFLEGFMPLGQDADSIVFLDMRLDYGENSRGSTSLGLGFREIVGPDLILGANVFVDAVRTENSNTFAGATLGLEAFTSIFDLRVNAHVPIGGGATLSPIVTGDGVSVVNNQLVENRSRTNRKEGLLYGLTGEIGAMFDSPFADNQRLRAYAGGYVYDRSGYDTQAGGRLGLEYQINDVLSLAGSRFTLGAELVYDKDDEFDAIASARLRIPLFAGAQSRDANGESRLSAIQQRMDEGVRRDKGIRVGTSSSTTAVNGVPVINPATGNPFGGVYYADQAGGGTGGFADPTSLATAVANAGTDGIVIALGGGGPITTSGITLQSGQTLIGGGESIQVQLADGSTTNFLLSGTNGTIDGDPGVTTVTLASGVTIRDLTIQGGTTVIGGNAVSNFTLTDLNIQNATDGISVTGAINANVSNISFSGITGTSLFLNNQSATISNITINGGTNGLSIANNTGTTTLSNINVSNVSGDALSFSNNTGIINVSGFTATNTGDDAIAVTGGGTFGFTGTTTLSGLGAGATSDGIDLSNTNNATLTFGDVDVTGLGGGTGLNMAGADATLTMQSLDITGAGTAGSKGVDLSGTQNGRTVTITNGGTITNVDVGLVLGTNGGAFAAPDAVFTWGGGDIGGLTYALDGIGVNAANGSYAFGTTGFSGPFNFTTSGTPNYFIAASATGTGDGSSTANRASIATAIGAAAGLGTVNFILINDGSAIDTAGATFALADNQTIDTFGDGRTFTSAGLIIAANITGTNLPTGSVTITDPGSGAATLTNSSGAVSTIAIANGNAIRNITLGSTLGTALSGSGIAGLTIEGVTIGTGTDTPVNGIALTNTTGAVTLTNVDITNSSGTGLSLTGASGTVTGNNVDITGANALSVSGGDAAVSFNATSSVTNTSGTAVSITNRIGGSFSHFGGISSNGPAAGGISVAGATAASDVTFGGQVSLGTTTALGGGAGVDIDNNGQASAIAFTGGLEIATTGQTGFSAQGGGSVAVAATGGAETITTAGAMALSFSGIGTGAGGVTFDSITGSGDGTVDDGISLTDLGAGSSITVTGTTTLDNYDVNGIEISGLSNAGQTIAFGTTTINQTASVAGASGIVIDTISATGVNIDFGTTQIGAGTVTTAGVVIGNVTGAATGFAADFASLTTNRAQTGLLVNTVDAGTVGITGPALVQNAQTANISVQGSDGGVAFGGAVTTQNNSGFNGDHILLGTAAANTGTVTFAGQVTTTSTGSTGRGVTLGSGAASFNGGLAITTTSGTGLVGTGGTLGIANAGATSVAASAGQAVSLAGVTIATGGITFDSLSSSASGASGVALTGVTGDAFTVTGTTTVTNATSAGIALSGNAANVAFGATTVTASTTGNGVDISGVNTGTISFTDLDIALTGANTVAFDLNGATLGGAVTVNDFDVTSTSASGTIGVDLRGLTGGQTVRLGDPAAAGASSSIAGVETGVFLNATSNATFVYGDGEGATDRSSTISATTAIDATNAPVAGTYNFQDVDFAGSPGAGFGIGAIYFVDSDGNATGGGDGSGSDASNPMTLAAAEAAAGAGDIIVLIDNGSAITAAGTNANNTLNLAANQQLLSFGDGAGNSQAIQVSLTVPPTIQLFAAGLTIADPTGNGAATLTTSAGNDVVTLGGDGIRVSGIDFEGNGTAARAINDAGGATGTVIERSSVSNFATVGIEITPSTNTTINDVDFSGNAGDILLNAAGSTLTNITSTGATGTAITLTNATGTTTLSNIDISNAANGIAFNNASGTVTATNVDIAGGNTLSIDGGDAVFTFDADSSISTTTGASILMQNRSGGSFTHAGSVVANGGSTSGITSVTSTGAHSISFTGTVDVGTTTAVGGSGVFIDNSGQNVTVNFADIDIETDGGFGMVVQLGGTLSVGTGSLAVNNAQIINFGSIAFGAGGVNFSSITGTGVGGVGVGLNTVSSGALNVSGTTSISGSTGSAVSATNVSSNMQFGTVNLTLTSGDGLLLAGNSGTLTTGDMTIAMGTGGNGIRATGTNGNMTFGNVDITNVGTGTGLNLSGGTFDGQVTFATLDITGTSQTGSKGIDLTDYDNTKDVVTTGSGAIQGVQTGIDLTNSNIANGVRFQYGDGSAPVASSIDTSGIAGNVAIVTTGVTATGEYDFEDIGFGTSNVSNLTGPVVFVVDQNNSSGAGTFSDPGSISEAAAATADVIVLIDTDTGTGTQTVSTAGPLSLDNGQVLIGLDSGTTSIDVSTLGITASGPPASVLLTGLGSSSTITSTVTLDSNRLVLNSSSGNTINLTGSAGIQNVAITNTGTGDGISASFSTAESVTVRSSSIGGGTGGFAIDLATTSGASTYAFSDLALTSGVRLDGSAGGSLGGTMTGTNTIDGASGAGLQLTNASGSFSNITFGASSAIGGAGIQIANSDASDRSLALENITMGSGGNGDTGDVGGIGVDVDSSGTGALTVSLNGTNTIRSTGQALDADETGAGTPDNLRLSIRNTTFESAAAGVPSVEITGQNVSSTTSSVNVRAFSDNAVIGNGTGGGILFTGVDFNINGGGTVAAGTLNVGQGTGSRVSGDGVSFIDTTGSLGLVTLNVYNTNGTGLEVNTKGSGTTFALTGGGTGTIDTTSGTALFLDPLTMGLSFSSVSSTNATGAGVLVDAGDASGGAASQALNIGTLNVTGSTGAGVRITNSTGTFNFGATTINNAGSTGGGVDLDLGAGDTATVNFTGALDIDTNSGTGFDANGTAGTLLTVNVASAGTQAINSATGGLLSFNQVAIGASGVSFDSLGSSGKISGSAVTMTNVGGAGTFSGGSMNIAGATTNGIDISASSGAFTFAAVTIGSNSTADNVATGIRLNANTGSFTLTGGSIIHNPTASGVSITSSGAGFAADFQAQIEVRNHTIATASAGDGFVLTSNSTATIDFANLVYNDDQRSSAPTGQAIVANDAGVLTISNGTIRTNNALGNDVYAVDISNTTTGAGGITIGSLDIDYDDAGESGGGIRLVSNTGTFSFTGVTKIAANNASGILANNTGTLNIGTTTAGSITSDNRAVFDITNTTVNLNATATRSTSSTGSGMVFNTVGGTVNLTGDMTITGSAGTGLSVSNSASGATFTFSGGTKTISTGGLTAISLTNNANGTVTFSGANTDIDTTSGNAVTVTNGGTINFNSTTTNTINSTTGKGVFASGGGTVVIGGSANVTSTTGTAVDIQNTTIGGAGVTFESVSADGATNGIVLSNAGSGGFAVTGEGSSDTTVNVGTRGRTSNKAGGGSFSAQGTGGTVQNTTGAAVLISNTNNVTLRNMVLTDSTNTVNSGNDGIDISNSSGFTLDNSRITGFSGNHGIDGANVANITIINSEIFSNATVSGVAAPDIHNVHFDELTGAGSTVTNSLFHSSYENIFTVENSSGTLTIDMNNVEIRDTNAGAGGNIGLLFDMTSSAQINATVRNSTFLRNRSRGVAFYSNSGTTGGSITISNNTFNDNIFVPIDIAHQSNATVTYNISGNQVNTDATAAGESTAINIITGGASSASTDLRGELTNNTIGNNTLAGSGSNQGVGLRIAALGAGTHTTRLTNNTVQAINQDSAVLISNDNTGVINATFGSGNTFTVAPAGAFPLYGLSFEAGTGAGSAGIMRVNFAAGVTATGSAGAFTKGIQAFSFGSSRIELQGYGGSDNDTASVATFLSTGGGAGNTVNPGPADVFVFSGGTITGTLTGGASVPLP